MFCFSFEENVLRSFDCDECCCSAKIWSVVKPRFWLHVSLGLCACVTDYLSFFFLLIDCEMFNKHTHIYTQDNKTDLACTVLQNVVNIAACTHKFPIIYIYIHTRCTLYYCHWKLRSCHIDGETWCCAFFFSSSSAPFFFFLCFVRCGRKKFLCFRIKIVLLSQLYRTYTHPMWEWKKKVQSLLFVWLLFVLK